MRTLTQHQVNPANDLLTITVADAPGSGNAHHLYEITGFTDGNPSLPGAAQAVTVAILFQNGPIAENGVNGLTHEALLAIIEDRLECFQAGPYACADNAEALMNIRAAQHLLQRRTRERMARGVEGTHKV